MKIRIGFVSNSSSSSYICDVCSESVIGYDISLMDYEMYQCENGHIFCEKHMSTTPTDIELLKIIFENDIKIMAKRINNNPNDVDYKRWFTDANDRLSLLNSSNEDEIIQHINEEWCDYINESRYEYPKEFCPLCRFDNLSYKDVYDYIDKKHSIEKIREEIKKKFNNYNEFKKFLKDD